MKRNGSYTIAAVGDCMLSREVEKHFRRAPEEFNFKDIKPILNGHDLIIANLENPVGTKGTPDEVQDPHVTFISHPDTLRILKELGVNAVSLGNNHMLDYGEAALIDTLESLDAYGIRHAGAGRNYEEANRPLVMELPGRRIAILSHVFIYSASTRMATLSRPGVADHRINRILANIREMKRNGCHVIVTMHWGMEYSFYPLPYQMKQARMMIDNGASLILGHGPHYPQGMERYKDGHIVYSMGNFIFDEPHIFSNRSFIYSAEIGTNGIVSDSCLHPVRIKDHLPRPLAGADKAGFERFINHLGDLYPMKSKTFWKNVNNRYFNDVMGRVIRMRSLKFLTLPPASFYTSIGLGNFVRKLKLSNLSDIAKYPVRRAGRAGKALVRKALPLKIRKRVAIKINKQKWLRGSGHLALGLVRDLSASNPKAFHKFLWENHIAGYAEWYDDSRSLFDFSKMEPSRVEFFNDLKSVIKDMGLATADFRSALDVGCSQGYLLRYIETELFPGAQDLAGIDIDAKAVEKGAAHLKNLASKVRLVSGDMESIGKLFGDGKFDLVFAAGVLSYLNEADAQKVVNEMMQRTGKLVALVGIANKDADNNTLESSKLSPDHTQQWIHNFETLIKKAGGSVVFSRWEGARNFNNQTLNMVFATPKAGC